MSRTYHREREGKHRRSARYDKACRSHGGCPYCYRNKCYQQHNGTHQGVATARDDK